MRSLWLKCTAATLALATSTACQYPLMDQGQMLRVQGSSSGPDEHRDPTQDPGQNTEWGKKKPLIPIIPPEPDKGKKTPVQVGWPPRPIVDRPIVDPGQDHEDRPTPGRPHHPDRPSRPPRPSGPSGPSDFESGGWDGSRSGTSHAPRDSTARVERRQREEESVGSPLGDSCRTSRGEICLGLKYVVYQDPSSREPVESDRDVIEVVRQVNELWRECGIQFQVDRYLPINPERYHLRYRTAHYPELNQIRRQFMDESTLLVVTTGSWNRAGSLGDSWANAWTNLPGEQWYGAVLEAPVGRNANVVAHELGHYLSLDHAQDPRDLMHPVIYRSSSALTSQQCESARWAAGYFWKRMLR